MAATRVDANCLATVTERCGMLRRELIVFVTFSRILVRERSNKYVYFDDVAALRATENIHAMCQCPRNTLRLEFALLSLGFVNKFLYRDLYHFCVNLIVHFFRNVTRALVISCYNVNKA